ncbi:MAG TPA: hypothetical protein VLG14_03520 [Sphingomonas sp.]|nr:hypothetical protein [Sphingomonas sp.]
MIDSLVLGLTHGLLLLTAWRLIHRPDLDDESAPPPGEARQNRWGRKRA